MKLYSIRAFFRKSQLSIADTHWYSRHLQFDYYCSKVHTHIFIMRCCQSIMRGTYCPKSAREKAMVNILVAKSARKVTIEPTDEKKLSINQADGFVKLLFLFLLHLYVYAYMRCYRLLRSIALYRPISSTKISAHLMLKYSTRHLTKAFWYTHTSAWSIFIYMTDGFLQKT